MFRGRFARLTEEEFSIRKRNGLESLKEWGRRSAMANSQLSKLPNAKPGFRMTPAQLAAERTCLLATSSLLSALRNLKVAHEGGQVFRKAAGEVAMLIGFAERKGIGLKFDFTPAAWQATDGDGRFLKERKGFVIGQTDVSRKAGPVRKIRPQRESPTP